LKPAIQLNVKEILFLQQPRIEAGDARLDFLYMLYQLIQDEAVACGELALQGIEQFFATGLESLANRSTSCGGCPSISALTMARADWPWLSLTTTPSRIPPSVRSLCRRFFSEASSPTSVSVCRGG
jgi:hypothetical protein